MKSGANQTRFPGWLRAILIGRSPKRTFVRIVALVVGCFLVHRLVLLPIEIVGPSMLPTFADRGVNLVNRLAYIRSGPKRGDVVAIRLAGEHMMYMKRVVGLPGETVAFRNGQAVINGQVLDEPYVMLPCDWELPPVLVRPNCYYVVGDNRSMAARDHEKGVATRERILGKVILCKNLFASSSPQR
jgi:signal peptidase I